MIIDKTKLEQLDSRYRATFINSLAGVKQAVLVGTQPKLGHNNLAIFNSLIHIGANPPLWGLLFRPDNGNRHTLNAILATHVYTINFVVSSDLEKAHQTSAKYAEGTSEFDACGFKAMVMPGIAAPFVDSAPIKVAMQFEEQINIATNNTQLIIGSIQHIEIAEELLRADGFVDHEKAKSLACVGLDAYYETRFLQRLSYAKPQQWPTPIA